MAIHRHYTLLLFCIIWSGGALADSVNQEFIKQFNRYTQFHSLTVPFTQKKYLQELKNPLTSQGELTIDRNNQTITWNIQSPALLLVTIAPREITMESGEGAEKQKQIFAFDQMNQTAQGWKDLSLWTDFNPQKIVENYKISKEAGLTFSLVAKQSTHSPFEKIQITGTGKGDVASMTLFEKSKDKVIIEFAPPKILKP